MDIRKLQRAIVDGLEDVKAQHIVVFNTEHLSPLFERVIIASGTSNRQTKALASSVRETVKSRGLSVLRTEGQDNGEWIIVDCGAAVAHIMQPAIRDYYHLEEIWGGKPVRLKLGSAPASLPKASAEAPQPRAAAPAPAPAARAAKAPPRPASAAKAPTRGGARRGAAPAKKAVTRTVGVKSARPGAAASKAAGPRAAGRKATARPSAARKAAAGKAKRGA